MGKNQRAKIRNEKTDQEGIFIPDLVPDRLKIKSGG